MSTSNTPAPTPPEPTPEKPKRVYAYINLGLVDEISLAREIAGQAASIDYAAALATKNIDAAYVAELAAKVTEANGYVTNAGDKSTKKASTTITEKTRRGTLMECIAIAQACAKLDYPDLKDPLRRRYYIGLKFATTRKLLETSAQAILNRLTAEPLVNMKPEDVAALQNAFDAYTGVQTTQTDDQVGITIAHSLFAAKVKVIAQMRRHIQYAVDAIWPCSRTTNAAVRVAFKLLADHPAR